MRSPWVDVTLVVPVKHLDRAKSRLGLPGDLRRALALAFCEDTLRAAIHAVRVRDVVVVTPDPRVHDAVRGLPVRVAAERGRGHGAAIIRGWSVAAALHPEAAVAVLPADLPCLRAADLDAVLEEAAACQAGFVPDLDSRGTTLLIAPGNRWGLARYGPGSAAAHDALGLRRLPARPGLRLDVDAPADLRTAQQLGVGSRTCEVLPQVPSGVSGTDPSRPRSSDRLEMPSLA